MRMPSNMSLPAFVQIQMTVRARITERIAAGEVITDAVQEEVEKQVLAEIPDILPSVAQEISMTDNQVVTVMHELLDAPFQYQRQKQVVQETISRIIIVLLKYQYSVRRANGITYAEITRNVSQKYRRFIQPALLTLRDKDIVHEGPSNTQKLYKLNLSGLNTQDILDKMEIDKKQEVLRKKAAKKASNKRYRNRYREI